MCICSIWVEHWIRERDDKTTSSHQRLFFKVRILTVKQITLATDATLVYCQWYLGPHTFESRSMHIFLLKSLSEILSLVSCFNSVFPWISAIWPATCIIINAVCPATCVRTNHQSCMAMTVYVACSDVHQPCMILVF